MAAVKIKIGILYLCTKMLNDKYEKKNVFSKVYVAVWQNHQRFLVKMKSGKAHMILEKP